MKLFQNVNMNTMQATVKKFGNQRHANDLKEQFKNAINGTGVGQIGQSDSLSLSELVSWGKSSGLNWWFVPSKYSP